MITGLFLLLSFAVLFFMFFAFYFASKNRKLWLAISHYKHGLETVALYSHDWDSDDVKRRASRALLWGNETITS